MSPTLLEGAIAILLLWIAWRIGSLLAPLIARRYRNRATRWEKPERKNDPEKFINPEK